MSRYVTSETECHEVTRTSGVDDGRVIGLVVKQTWFDPSYPWNAFQYSGRDCVWLGRFETKEKAAARIAGEGE